MATLLLSAVGTALGGPIGGALGALAGQQIDQAVFGSPKVDGARLSDLSVTTSTYGAAIPRHHGRMRVAGSLIWATDLSESSESTGGKGQPSVTTYSYSVSFAVALSSRPVQRIGRIWADGNLLRGAAGDLKTGGTLRFYSGHGDQAVDPLMASDKGVECPAYRHTAYVVFEDLQLADFGNRIPALTFEVFADNDAIVLADILEPLDGVFAENRPLSNLEGYSVSGGSLSNTLATLGTAYPLILDSSGERLSILPADATPDVIPVLPEAAPAYDGESFGQSSGRVLQRQAAEGDVPNAIRYYDVERDYQSGLQRTDGQARPGRGKSIEIPGTLSANAARSLINSAAQRARWARETLAWRLAELDPTLTPGSLVRIPEQAGNWRITGWEWRDTGVELELVRQPRGPARESSGDSGSILSPVDRLPAPTVLRAYEAPWDGNGSADTRALFAAPSSASAGWSGAALYSSQNGELTALGGSGSKRSVIGQIVQNLSASPSLRLERESIVDVQLLSEDFALSSSTPAGLANGANRAMIGEEILQFSQATALGNATWRLQGLLRGRAGTEGAALAGHGTGANFILLDSRPVPLDPSLVGPSGSAHILAIGLGDEDPVSCALTNPGLTLRPLSPVHPSSELANDGMLNLNWTRRARGAWNWPDEVDIALNEQSEAYRVGLGSVETPDLYWDVSQPSLAIDAGTLSTLQASHSGAPIWVRQIGSHALSPALLLTTL